MGEKEEEGDRVEVRGVETIEEFFRPEFAHNTQSLGNINDDSDDDINEEEMEMTNGEGEDGARKRVKLSDMNVSKDEEEELDEEDGGAGVAGGQRSKEKFRNMGFPNMNYLDPDAKG